MVKQFGKKQQIDVCPKYEGTVIFENNLGRFAHNSHASKLAKSKESKKVRVLPLLRKH